MPLIIRLHTLSENLRILHGFSVDFLLSGVFMALHFPALITLLTVLLLLWTGVAVAKARAKYGVKAPATTGNDDFERVFRVQMNTQENAMLFLPTLWLFSLYISPLWGGVLGLVWLAGRIYYAVGYIRVASARAPGFMISMGVVGILLLGAVSGIAMKLAPTL
jgi:glutathione S-transferase